MRIGMLVDVYKPHVSGITTYISLNKQYLEKMGHQVFVFTFGDEDYQDDETNVIRTPGLPLLDTGYYFSLRFGKKARQLLHTMDVAHVHHPFLSGSLALSYCRPRGIPIVFTNHTRYDLYASAYLPVLGDMLGETTISAFMPTFCRNCDLVIAPSNGMRKVLEHYGVDAPIDVIPNGVDLEPFREPTSPLDRAQFGFSPQDVVLIYVGRLGPEKNLAFLLRSFAGATQAYENIRLLLVGDGPERENLEDRVAHTGLEDRVHFTGMVDYAQLPGYMATADAFVTASVTEVHPMTVIEAMASGLPVLGIDSPGIGDTIEDGVTGYLVHGEDVSPFTAKMIRLVTDHAARKSMGQQALRASKKYAIERTTQMVSERYEALAAKTKRHKKGVRARLLALMDGWTL